MPRNSENSTDLETDTSYPDWDGVTPIDMRAWYRKLPKRLRRSDSRYRTLWEMGFVLSKDTVLAPSRKHALALKDSDVASHTFENPITEDSNPLATRTKTRTKTCARCSAPSSKST
jgi:hypothetical protein